MDAREVALDVLMRVDTEGAYANRLLPAVLDHSGLDARDRGFVTELVYGTTRMRRACDFLVDRFLLRAVEPRVRAVLRLGAYQLHCLGTPPHAAVNASVAVAPPRARGLVNAVLRRVAGAPVDWPDVATRLSYPDWIVDRLISDLGEVDALAALEQMNLAPSVTEREDGYIQDEASQWVAALVDAGAGEWIADVCAAPGGKATAIAAAGARVVAGDVRPSRARDVARNAVRLGSTGLAVIAADGRRPPLRAGLFARVLVDAPCSGLGALRRRPDARWRITEADVGRLAGLQRDLLEAAVGLVEPGGVVVYSVCTLTEEESLGVDAHVADAHPSLTPVPAPGRPWEPYGRGARLLPQAAGTDGMCLFRWRRPPTRVLDADGDVFRPPERREWR